jgi:hypothetical protein
MAYPCELHPAAAKKPAEFLESYSHQGHVFKTFAVCEACAITTTEGAEFAESGFLRTTERIHHWPAFGEDWR